MNLIEFHKVDFRYPHADGAPLAASVLDGVSIRIASLLLQSGAIVYYLPALLLAALPTGICTGHLLNSLLQSNSGALQAFAPRRKHDNLPL